jgi:sulfite reductase alpha subunit-like flavoprotein
MAKRLSEQLADLSVHAKKAEDAVTAAQKETHDKIMARWEQARADATATTEKVNEKIQSVGDSAAKGWNARKAKIAADMDALKAKVVQKKHERDARRAESEADTLEWDAGLAIDYAIASVDQARLAVLDAVAGRIRADEARKAS